MLDHVVGGEVIASVYRRTLDAPFGASKPMSLSDDLTVSARRVSTSLTAISMLKNFCETCLVTDNDVVAGKAFKIFLLNPLPHMRSILHLTVDAVPCAMGSAKAGLSRQRI